MAANNKHSKFFDSEKGQNARRLLQLIAEDDDFNTEPTFSANKTLYPDNQIPFVDKHMNYLSAHQNIEPRQYIANLRLTTRIR